MSESMWEQAANIITGSDALVIAAGAGIGVDSGLPDFSSNNGLWKAYPALAAAQIDFTEVASPRTFNATRSPHGASMGADRSRIARPRHIAGSRL